MAQNTVSVTSPALQEATKSSTIVWRQDLEALFHHAKDRFPDVVWEVGEGDDIGQELWGHKGAFHSHPTTFLLNVAHSGRLCTGTAQLPGEVLLVQAEPLYVVSTSDGVFI